MRKRRALVVILVPIALVLLAVLWLRYGRDLRASVFILSGGDFSAPELRMDGRLIRLPNTRDGPWRHYAWANLRPHLA